MKARSYFFHKKITQLLINNQKTNKAAGQKAAQFLDDTGYWMNLTYKELKELVFSPELTRSWFVLSDGSCPSCKGSVPMYNWLHDPFDQPWKMKCPHCSELFPSNDFEAYYKSGLDEKGRFIRESADSSLLVSDTGGYVVDDGNGWYDENNNRYMFIGAYLCHAQWERLVKKGIFQLAFSYVLSGNEEYSIRAAILLDAVSAFWPEFDFYTQGLMYEKEFKSNGYVTYWVNSNRDARIFALAYDQIFENIRGNDRLAEITGKSCEDICTDIEEKILRNCLQNVRKISTNPPETPLSIAILKTVLDYEEKKDEILQYIDDLIEEATRVDGLSGESGLSGYAAISPRAIADLLCLYSNIDDNLMSDILQKHPQLYKTYRFHIDTWYEAKYYPGVGDSSIFALPMDKYTALFSKHNPLSTVYFKSREWFIMMLSEYYKDPDMAKTIYLSRNKTIEGTFDNDLYIDDPLTYEEKLRSVLRQYGESLEYKSINYHKWRISILHTGSGSDKTMLAMPYASGANHCHHDALSLHLFSKGINMTADFGYPPVNYGGWDTKEANWYKQPAAHNTVVIDGKMHTNLPPGGDGMFYRYPEYGRNLLFCDKDFVHAAYNEAREYADADRFERLSVLVDVSEKDCYCLDIFRVSGGKDHARFQRSTYADISFSGIKPAPGQDYDTEKTIMRSFMTDENPSPDWFVDFCIQDEYKVLEEKRNLHLRYIPLTDDVSAAICESWVDITRMTQADNNKAGNREIWIPTLIERKTGDKSQFTGVLIPYENSSFILKAAKISHKNEGFVEAVSVIHKDGTEDIIIVNDPEFTHEIIIEKPEIRTDALLSVIRLKNRKPVKCIMEKGSFIIYEGTALRNI